MEQEELDAEALAEVEMLLDRMTMEEIIRFCEGTLKVALMGQQAFHTRFPEQYQEWNARVASGEVKL